MRKYINIIAVITVSIFMMSCDSEEKKVLADNSDPIVVRVSAIQSNEDSPFVSASGKIQAENSAELSTRMMGFVNKVHVNVGDQVSKGQLLVAINNSDLQAQRAQINASITEATAAFNNAQKDYNRFKNLFEDNSASQKELDDMTTNYEMAQARLEAANQMKNEVNSQFAYSNITAPFSGVITSKNIEVGDMANPGVPLISMEVPGKFQVVSMVSESEISEIKKGTEVDVLVKSINKIIKGKVSEVSSSAKNTGGQFLVKIALYKTDSNILSGMFTTVQFPIAKNTEVSTMVLIPKDAIVTRGQLTGIYTTSESNTAVLRWLRLGRTFGDKVEVLSGLSIHESFIVSADGKLFNGAKISIQ
jgi:RND family efflux transporter MFP subunit